MPVVIRVAAVVTALLAVAGCARAEAEGARVSVPLAGDEVVTADGSYMPLGTAYVHHSDEDVVSYVDVTLEQTGGGRLRIEDFRIALSFEPGIASKSCLYEEWNLFSGPQVTVTAHCDAKISDADLDAIVAARFEPVG